VSANQLKTAEVLIPVIKDIKVLQKIIYNQLQAAMLGQKSASQATADAASEWDGR
jgi:putative chitobiose transport system substrate-binding protein